MFSDAVYGGKEAARRAARKHKRSVVSNLPDRSFRGFGAPVRKGKKRSAAKKRRR
jgi:hypothetical protein